MELEVGKSYSIKYQQPSIYGPDEPMKTKNAKVKIVDNVAPSKDGVCYTTQDKDGRYGAVRENLIISAKEIKDVRAKRSIKPTNKGRTFKKDEEEKEEVA